MLPIVAIIMARIAVPQTNTERLITMKLLRELLRAMK